MIFSKIDAVMDEIAILLESDGEIDENIYFPSCAKFNRELRALLDLYHESSEDIKAKMSPSLNYYRQVQHYLVFIMRYPSILKVPHHSEILQALYYIKNKNPLLKSKYKEIASQKSKLLKGKFKENLERLYSSK